MTTLEPFQQETREEVVRSVVNWSKSKQLWTFPKKRRFQTLKAECPHVAYQQNLTTLTNTQVKFTTSARRIFDDIEKSPSPADYAQSKQKSEKGLSFGLSREHCKFNSYIKPDLSKNPSPCQYDKFLGEDEEKSKKGFTMRPRTANNRNYFIDNKELQEVPSPMNYNFDLEKKGESKVAKFRSVTLGGAGLMKRSKRFLTFSVTPGPSSYEPKKQSLRNKSLGCRIGSSLRTSFIDSISQNYKSPGPGNYQLPSQFGHYKKMTSRSRMVTIQ